MRRRKEEMVLRVRVELQESVWVASVRMVCTQSIILLGLGVLVRDEEGVFIVYSFEVWTKLDITCLFFLDITCYTILEGDASKVEICL